MWDQSTRVCFCVTRRVEDGDGGRNRAICPRRLYSAHLRLPKQDWMCWTSTGLAPDYAVIVEGSWKETVDLLHYLNSIMGLAGAWDRGWKRQGRDLFKGSFFPNSSGHNSVCRFNTCKSLSSPQWRSERCHSWLCKPQGWWIHTRKPTLPLFSCFFVITGSCAFTFNPLNAARIAGKSQHTYLSQGGNTLFQQKQHNIKSDMR